MDRKILAQKRRIIWLTLKLLPYQILLVCFCVCVSMLTQVCMAEISNNKRKQLAYNKGNYVWPTMLTNQNIFVDHRHVKWTFLKTKKKMAFATFLLFICSACFTSLVCNDTENLVWYQQLYCETSKNQYARFVV